MRTDPVSSAVESDHSSCVPVADRAPVDKAHADRTAQLFAAEYSRLVHYMFARTGSLAEAHDVASQAFAQILEMDNPQTVSLLRAYVYSAARNIWIDRVKIGAIHRRIDEIVRYDPVTTTPSPEPLLIEGQRARVLHGAIERLRPSRKAVLVWRIWDDLTYREIAARLAKQGEPVDERTVSNWFKEALEELGDSVQGLAEDLKEEGIE